MKISLHQQQEVSGIRVTNTVVVETEGNEDFDFLLFPLVEKILSEGDEHAMSPTD